MCACCSAQGERGVTSVSVILVSSIVLECHWRYGGSQKQVEARVIATADCDGGI